MSITHTPEPWLYRGGEVYSESSGRTVARCNIGGEDAVTEANGERIVACVNACNGINPKAVPDLLAALEACLPVLDNPAMHWELKTARAAIAKAKGIQ